MSNLTRNSVAAIVVMLLAGTVSFAQSSGEATYKAKCQMCHGEKGLADSGAGKAMKVKPATDPDVKKLSEAQMIDAVRNGIGQDAALQGQVDRRANQGCSHVFPHVYKVVVVGSR